MKEDSMLLIWSKARIEEKHRRISGRNCNSVKVSTRWILTIPISVEQRLFKLQAL
jgi:hypothetical protein